jgi:hypothetical protein
MKNRGHFTVSVMSTKFQLNMWRSALFVEKTGVPGENDRPVANH